MNIYRVSVQRGNCTEEFNVVAKNTYKVTELIEKCAKKNYWYAWRINIIEFYKKADLVQK